jgi:polyphosphate kinase 2 (PPK2 family)
VAPGKSNERGKQSKKAAAEADALVARRPPSLRDADLTRSLSKEDEATELVAHQERLLQLRLASAGLTSDRIGPGLVVLFEGWDASGKGGAIRRLTALLDPRHVRVVQFAAPSDDERRHHYLARFVPALPGRGGMAVLDRSWYGRVLVERVERLCTEEEWRRSYDEINAFEAALANDGIVIVKIWLHISTGEQRKRFEARRDDPLKSWKLTDDDWHNRRRRPAYLKALAEMFERTHTTHAPWEVIPAENKPYARVEVLRRVNARFEAGLRAAGFPVPPAPKVPKKPPILT